jgi:transcriptional regulator with XRE-family HTH domain
MTNASKLAFSGDRAAVRRLLQRLREHRLQRNWSQAEIARRAGLSRAAYQNFEGGYGNITLANLVRLLGLLGYAHRLGDLLPPVEELRTLEDLEQKPRRQRARKTR